MQIVKTYLFFSGHDDAHPYLMDTIFHDGSWWLVASWLDPNDTGVRTPERLVRLSGLQYQEVSGQAYRFVLNNPIPKAVMDGTPQEGYVQKTHPAAANVAEPGSVH